jgi:cytochrome c oxidase assembly protein subunit 15
LAANITIVVTGGLVRLTGSGLGCPTWPRCSADSYVVHPALGYHGLIEFGNRMLTFALVIIALLTWVSALLHREDGHGQRRFRWLAGGLLLGIPVQAVIGGISVLFKLNPYIVALHLLVSMVLIALSVWLVRMTWRVPPQSARRAPTLLARLVFVVMWGVVIVGTGVTGSGPHAGDEHVARMDLAGLVVTQLHAALVYTAVAGTLACVVLLRSRAAVLLLLVEVGQAAVGLTQYHLGLPIWLVALHLLGASLAIATATNLVLSVSSRPRSPAPRKYRVRSS